VDKSKFQRLVGRLIYLLHSRPNIAYAVSVVNQFMHSPGESHMDAVKRIFSIFEIFTRERVVVCPT
jgi:hypothetical protein